MLALCLGEPTPQDAAYYNDRQPPVVLEGVIIQPPDERDTYTNLRVRLFLSACLAQVQGVNSSCVFPPHDDIYVAASHIIDD